MPKTKYYLSLPTVAGTNYHKDYGFDPQLAYKIATACYDADRQGAIRLVVINREIKSYQLRLPDPRILENPANCNGCWLELDSYDSKEAALNAAKTNGADSLGRIDIVDNDFIEEFSEIHLKIRLDRYEEHPEVDLEDLYRSEIADEIVCLFNDAIALAKKQKPRSIAGLIRNLEVDLEATDAYSL